VSVLILQVQDEVNQLRRYLPTQSAVSRSDPVTLPPPLLALLQPHINGSSAVVSGQTSSTMTAALIQRTRVLQDENDELYELLRVSETGKLKEEVRCLKRIVSRLERALKGVGRLFLRLLLLRTLLRRFTWNNILSHVSLTIFIS